MKNYKRFPKVKLSPFELTENDEVNFAQDIKNCSTLEEAKELSDRVLKEWSDFYASC